jgi:hypothetical protein
VKINLANMASSNSAYPDPLLLAYKSSVNWTRLRGFQLMAEAELPLEPEDPRYGGDIDGISEHSWSEEVYVG